MTINILKPLGNVGITSIKKSFISEPYLTVNVIGETEGTLIIGNRSYAVKNGTCAIAEYELVLGRNKVIFANDSGNYECGEICREGRFMHVHNHMDKLIISCATAYAEQAEKIKDLETEIKTLKKQYGISLI